MQKAVTLTMTHQHHETDPSGWDGPSFRTVKVTATSKELGTVIELEFMGGALSELLLAGTCSAGAKRLYRDGDAL